MINTMYYVADFLDFFQFFATFDFDSPESKEGAHMFISSMVRFV